MTRDEQAIRTLVAEWQAATAEGKPARLRPLLADDVTFLTPGQPPMKGRVLFVDGLKAAFRTVRIEPAGEVQEVGVVGDMAYCVCQLTVRVTPKSGGPTTTRAGHTLTVLRKQPDGAWVIARDANLLAPVDDD